MTEHYLITGAGSGIGRAIAQRLYTNGALLTLVGRRLSALQETAKHMDENRVRCQSGDIQDRHSLQKLCREASERGSFRGVIANAGIGGPNEPGENDRFDELVQTNLVGTYNTLRAVQPFLCREKLCHMVVVSSCLARFGVPGYTGYCASKAGLLGLVRALALELAPKVQVNAICPGWVDTQMARDGIAGMAQAMSISYEEAYRQAMSMVPLGRMSTPEEIAGSVSWLISPDAWGMTGQGIDINAGSWMG